MLFIRLSRQMLRTAPAALMTAILLTTATASWAAEPESDPSGGVMELGIEQLLQLDVPTVYGASKYEQRVTDAPASVSIVTAEEIKKYGYRTMADILRSVPGFYVSSDRNYSYLGVRGFNRPGDYNTRVLMLLDGHRLNDNVYDQAAIGNDFPLNIDLIEQVEIIRGPSSSLYGSSAFLGVINVVSRQGKDLKGVEVAVSGGSQETYQGEVSYGNKFDNGMEALVSGTAFTSSGEQQLFFPEYAIPELNNGVANNADRERAYKLFTRLSLQELTLTALFSSRNKTIPTGSYGVLFNNAGSNTTDSRSYLALSYQHKFEDHSELAAHLSYDNYHYYADYLYGAAPGDPPLTTKDSALGEWLGGEIQYSRRFFQRQLVTVGGEFRDNFTQNQMAAPLDDHRTSRGYGMYLQDEWQILNNLILNAGVRYDWHSTFGGSTNPRLGLIYRPVPATILKFLYGTAFRAPNVYELYYYAAGQQANPFLQPEKMTTYEAVYEQYLGLNLQTSLSGFYYQATNLISQDSGGTYVNNAKTDARGMEAQLSGKWANGLQGRLGYTYLDARDMVTNSLLTNAPRHLATFNLSLPFLDKRLFFSPEILYTGPRTTVTGATAGGFVTANLTIFSHGLLPGLELSGTVYNLFDESYDDPAAGEHYQNVNGRILTLNGIPQDGRTFRVKVTYRF